MKTTPRIITVDELIHQTYQKLEQFKYSKRILKKFDYSFTLFKQYALKNEVTLYTEKLAFSFLEEYCELFSNKDSTRYVYQERKRSIAKLDEMYKYNEISSRKLFSRKTYLFYGCLESTIKDYIALKESSVSSSSVKSIKLYLEYFSLYISKNKSIHEVYDLDIQHIVKYIEISSKTYTHNTLYASITCIKKYLIYLEENKLIKKNIVCRIPKVNKKRNRSYPDGFTKEEATALLNSITNDNSRERRDYAMLLLAARVGLRSSDIINLKFSNIDWQRNEINIVQQKTKTPVTLPLLKDAGEAIINYIKNGRPDTKDQHIFIRESKPYMKLSSSSLHMIVDGYLKRAKIKIPTGKKHGPHALRHSLATLLLENNIPISTIKEILAHQSTETTKIYLKVSEKQLLQCALDVAEIDNISSSNGELYV